MKRYILKIIAAVPVALLFYLTGAAQVNMQANGNNTVTCGGNLQFFDSGGSGSNYTANQTLVHTFCPSASDRLLRVRILSYALVDQDAFLTIFDGSNINAPPIASITGIDASSAFIFSSSQPGGCLTFRFTSGSGTPLAGFQALLSCSAVTPPGQIWTQSIEAQQGTNTGACMVNTCAGSYTDDGGLSASYSGNVQGIYRTFCPNIPNNCLRITFNSPFGLEGTPPNACVDALIVRNGPTQNSTVINTLCGSTVPAAITSTDDSGCLSFQFFSSSLNNQTGWNATFSCVPCAQSAQDPGAANDCDNGTNPPIVCGLPPDISEQNATGPGIASDGCNGCVVSENYTKWFRLRTTTAGEVMFDIAPAIILDDYDFAVYGPFAPGGGCNNLGSPIRCSYAANISSTGLTNIGADALQKSEDVAGNGFVGTFQAQAGEDYLIMVNRWNPGGFNFNVDVEDCNTDPLKACYECIPLPAEIDYFSGRAYRGYNELNWQATQERNVRVYQVEKLVGGKWSLVTEVKASGARTFYVGVDARPSPKSDLYRLKSIDWDGVETVHKNVVEINQNFSQAPVKINANHEAIAVQLAPGLYPEPLELYDMAGTLVMRFPLPEKIEAATTITFLIGDKPGGVYVARIGKDTLKFYKD